MNDETLINRLEFSGERYTAVTLTVFMKNRNGLTV